MSLNPAQRRAVEHRGSPLLVLAGAGTGKTRVITHRVAALIDEGVPPWRILAVTFTNRAAGEMRERIAGLAGDEYPPRGLWVGTFHSICARIIRRHGESLGLSQDYAIYDAADQKTLMGRVLKEQGISPRVISPAGTLGWLDQAKNLGYGPEQLSELGLHEPLLSVVQDAWREYTARLRRSDAVDFGDLLGLAVLLLRRSKQDEAAAADEGRQLADFDPVARLRRRFTHVVVDEFQDTNPVQGALVDLLSERAELCVVGDDDQSIYGWRGADVGQILQFPEHHAGCEVIRLEQNYRSTTHILECADAVIRRNTGRLGKKLWSDLGDGEQVIVAGAGDEREEASLVARGVWQALEEDGVEASEVAVFYRTHAQSRALEEALRRAGIHYRIVGGTRFFDRLEVKDLIAYLRLMISDHCDLDLLRIINRPARGIGAKTIERLSEYASSAMIPVWSALDHAESAGLGTAARKRVKAFKAMIEQLREATAGLPLHEIAEQVLERTGYVEALAADDKVEAESRLENLQEFVGALAEFVRDEPESSLADYLELVSLATTEEEGEREQQITLMTVHSAKGLEFERVWLTGMEEKVFPHVRAVDDPEELEEERRLAYVAITRAKRRLTVSIAARRYIYGQDQVNPPSRFAAELPREHVRTLGRSPFASAPRRPAWADQGFDSSPAPAPAAPSWDDDIELEPEVDAGEGVSVYVGMPIRHPKFGVGEVLAWSGSGQDMKLTLRFPTEARTKTILARFCQPA